MHVYASLCAHTLRRGVITWYVDTAYFYRDAKYILGIQTIWLERAYQPVNTAWLGERHPFLRAITHGSYVNFPYSGLQDYEAAYYGLNACRLKRVKKMYDPCNIFCYPQCIRH